MADCVEVRARSLYGYIYIDRPNSQWNKHDPNLLIFVCFVIATNY